LGGVIRSRARAELAMLKLVIGNYNYSSWSLRAWLQLRASCIPFEVERIPLFSADWQTQVGRYSPAGRVPVLVENDLVVWDSMAIQEYVIERYRDAVGWPAEPKQRARARSISAEMHAGFIAIRNELPQNIRGRTTLSRNRLSAACRAQLQRIDAIWTNCRAAARGDGPWLFGQLSAADLVYVPVALRLVTYGITMSRHAEEFVAAVQSFGPVREWIDAAADEIEELPFIDDLRPIGQTPLTPG